MNITLFKTTTMTNTFKTPNPQHLLRITEFLILNIISAFEQHRQTALCILKTILCVSGHLMLWPVWLWVASKCRAS